MSRRTHRLLGTTAVLGLTCSWALVTAPEALADSRYSLSAQADAMFFEADYGAAPASPVNQAGSLTAHVDLDSNGNSAGFAGNPYYGATVTTLPGTYNGLVLGIVPVPLPVSPPKLPITQTPGYVSTRYPVQPTASSDQGPFVVHAKSDDSSSAADGTTGAPDPVPAPNQQQSVNAKVSVTGAGQAISTATATVEGITEGPVQIIKAVSSLTVTQDPDGTPKIAQSLSGSLSVAGVGLTYDNSGFKLANSALPVEATLDKVNTALAQAHFQIEALPAEKRTDPNSGRTSIVLGGLRVSTTNQVPGSPAAPASPATFVFEFARVAVNTVDVKAAGDGGSGVDLGTGFSSGGTDSSTGSAGGAAGGSASSAGSGTASAPGLDAGSLSPGSSGAGADSAPPVVSGSGSTGSSSGGGGQPVRTLGALSSDATGHDNQLFYLVLVVGGLLALGAQQLFSRFAIRLALNPLSSRASV